MNERRIVEDFSENDIKEFIEFQNSMYSFNKKIIKPKKTLITKTTIRYQKKKVQSTEIKFNNEIKKSIDVQMDWDKLQKEKDSLTVPVSIKSGDEVMEMKKRSYEELKMTTRLINEELLNSEEDVKSFCFLPNNKEDAVKILKESLKSEEVSKEDRELLVELYGEDAVTLFEQSV